MNKKDAFKMAWVLYRKGFAVMFADCLKAAWKLVKRINFNNNRVDIERATEIVNDNQANRNKFRDAGLAVKNDSTRKLDYKGEGRITFDNYKVWAVADIARVYFERFLDGVRYETGAIIQVRIIEGKMI